MDILIGVFITAGLFGLGHILQFIRSRNSAKWDYESTYRGICGPDCEIPK